MKRKIWAVAEILVLAIVLLCGCQDEKEKSSESQSVSESTVSPAGEEKSKEPEYLYDEFINTQSPDTSMLGKDEGTDEEVKELENDRKKIDKKLKSVNKKYIKDGMIEEEDVPYYLQEVMEEVQALYEQGEIAGYEVGRDCIEVELNSGISYIISPKIKDCNAGGSDTRIQVATYQPCRTDFIKERFPVKYLDQLDAGAELIDDAFEMYEFYKDGSNADNDLEDMEVTFESILKFPNYNIILWDGHGGYTDDKGAFLVVGDECTSEKDKKYMRDMEAGRILSTTSGHYAITGNFIREYIPDDALKNSIIYLGTCHSGEDERLVQNFLDKGAMAVYANSGTIYTKYNLSMIYSVSEGLTKQWDNGRYYTIGEALEYAKEENGENDGDHGTTVNLYTNPEVGEVSLDWYEDYIRSERDVVMVLDQSGSMGGEPLDETKEAASKFVDTVLEEDARVALVSYSNRASVMNDFSTRGMALKTNIETLYAWGDTNTYEAVEIADQRLDRSKAKKKIMLLMTDGQPNAGQILNGSYEDALVQYCEEMKKKGYYIYTLGFFSSLSGEDKTIPQNMLQDMASPGCHYEVQDAGDLVYFFGDIAGHIGGEEYVYIRIACPVDVRVSRDGETLSSAEEEQNTRTSFGSLTFEGDQNEIKVLRLKSDEIYDVDISGTGEGTMDYTISYMDDSGQYTDHRTFSQIPITSHTKIDTNTDGSENTILELDSDGDGEVDKTYEAGANEEGKEVEQKSQMPLYIGIGCGVAVLIIVVIIVVVVHKKKKKAQRGESEPVFIPALICVQGQYQGGVFEIPVLSTISIGRETNCNIILNHPKVSRRHCMVYADQGGRYQVMDYSANGTFVNDAPIIKGVPYHAVSGQYIRIGKSGNVFQLR